MGLIHIETLRAAFDQIDELSESAVRDVGEWGLKAEVR
jgi:hypothetical protein